MRSAQRRERGEREGEGGGWGRIGGGTGPDWSILVKRRPPPPPNPTHLDPHKLFLKMRPPPPGDPIFQALGAVLTVSVLIFWVPVEGTVERGLRLCTSKLNRQFPEHLKLELCSAAVSAAPAECVAALRYSRGLSNNDKVALCRGVKSTAPATCFKGEEGRKEGRGGREKGKTLRTRVHRS